MVEGSGEVKLMDAVCSLAQHDAAEAFGPGELSISAGKLWFHHTG